VDQDCDGQELCFLDEDDDGYGLSDTVVITGVDCVDAPGAADVDGDCDDQDDTIYPGADDAPADGIDSDCDGFDALDTGLTTDTDDPTETTSGRTWDPQADTGLPAKPAGGPAGCGCQTAPPSFGWVSLLGLLALCRRRESRP